MLSCSRALAQLGDSVWGWVQESDYHDHQTQNVEMCTLRRVRRPAWCVAPHGRDVELAQFVCKCALRTTLAPARTTAARATSRPAAARRAATTVQAQAGGRTARLTALRAGAPMGRRGVEVGIGTALAAAPARVQALGRHHGAPGATALAAPAMTSAWLWVLLLVARRGHTPRRRT